MTDALTALLSLCEEATPGPWRYEHSHIGARIYRADSCRDIAAASIPHDKWHEPAESQEVKDAAFIAHADPRTVAALVRVAVVAAEMRDAQATCAAMDIATVADAEWTQKVIAMGAANHALDDALAALKVVLAS